MPKMSVTIRDVALVAGVSKSAVSAAFTGNGRLSDETRAVILQTADQMGFEPNPNAQRLQNKGISDLIGLFTLDLDLSVGTRKIKLIRQMLTARGFSVQIHSCGLETQASPREVRMLFQQRPRAIICNNTDLPDETLAELQTFQENGGIVVSYDQHTALPCDKVVFDRSDNTYQAAHHLLKLGHRHIGFFKVGNNPRLRNRLHGFRDALGEYGLMPRPDWIFETDGQDEFEHDGARMAAHFLGLKERPSAVCILNDFSALAFIAEVQRAGLRVPEDVAVVGHDDRPIAGYCSVPLTTVSQPVETIAEKVVELLLERFSCDASKPYRQETVRGELIVRASSGTFVPA
jgi:LacI family transcriptional regulator